MKKLTKILAIALAGAALLLTTACCDTTELLEPKALLVKEINAYFEEMYDWTPTEVEELSVLEMEKLLAFKKAKSINLPDDVLDWESYCERAEEIGYDWPEYIGIHNHTSDGEDVWTLCCEYKDPVTLRAQVRVTFANLEEDMEYIGLGVMEINGTTYWTCTFYCEA